MFSKQHLTSSSVFPLSTLAVVNSFHHPSCIGPGNECFDVQLIIVHSIVSVGLLNNCVLHHVLQTLLSYKYKELIGQVYKVRIYVLQMTFLRLSFLFSCHWHHLSFSVDDNYLKTGQAA